MNELALEQSSYIFRMQFVERPDAKSSPVVVPNANGVRYTEFAFNPKAINTRVESELFVDRVAPGSWIDETIRPQPLRIRRPGPRGPGSREDPASANVRSHSAGSWKGHRLRSQEPGGSFARD